MVWSNLGGTDAASFTLSNGVLSFNAATNFEVKPSYSVHVTGTDAVGNASTQTLTINLTDVNEAPVAVGSIAPQSTAMGVAYTLDTSSYFSDPDTSGTASNRTLSYSVSSGNLPGGLTLNSSTGVISGEASVSATSANYTITATDGGGLSTSQTFALEVLPQPIVQSITVSDTTSSNGSSLGQAGETLHITVNLSEAMSSSDGLTAHFQINGQDITATASAVSHSNTISFSATVPAGDGNAISLSSISVNNAGTLTSDASHAALATPTPGALSYSAYTVDNTAPTLTTSYSTSENTAADTTPHSISLLATEAHGAVVWSGLSGADASRFTLSGSTLTFNAASNFETKQSYGVSITGTDAAGNSTTQALTITLTDVNEVPTAVGSIAAQIAGPNTAFTLNTSGYFADPDTHASAASGYHTLTYSLAGTLPTGLHFDTLTGILSGTATATAAQSTYTVTATDGGGLSATQTFTLQVAQPTVQSFTVVDTTTSNSATLGHSGETLNIVVTLSEAVSSTNALTAHFSINGTDVTATAAQVTNASTITFAAAVPANNNGTAISLTSLTVNSAGSITSDTTHVALASPTAGAISYAGYTVDNTAPSATLTTALMQNTGNAVVQSSDTGVAYLVHSSVTVTSLASITGAANSLWNSVAIGTANTDTNLAAAGLVDGTYYLYTADAAGNLSTVATNSVVLDSSGPVITAAYSVNENTSSDTTPKVITLAASDEHGPVVLSNLTGADAASFTFVDGQLTFVGATNYETKPVYTVSVTGTDAMGNSTVQALSINLTDVNEAPVTLGTIADQSAGVNQPFTLDTSVFFADPDAVGPNATFRTLTYSLTSGTLPAGLTLNTTTGTISGTALATATSASFTVTATDGGALSVSQTYNLQVLASIPSTLVYSNQLVTHSSAAGNLVSAATNVSTVGVIASNGSGLVFNNINVTQFGNGNTPFADSGIAVKDLVWWDSATGAQKLINHSNASGNATSTTAADSTYQGVTSEGTAVVFTQIDASKLGNSGGSAFSDSSAGATNLFWWNKSTGTLQLIDHGYASATASIALTSSSFGAIAADGSGVVFSNADATKFGNGVAFGDAGTSATDLFWWNAADGTQKLITHGSASQTSSASLTSANLMGLAANGSGVLFSTAASAAALGYYGNNGVAFTGTTNASEWIWWDKASGTQQLVTHSSVAGNLTGSISSAPTLSAIMPDGSGVLFSTYIPGQFGNNGTAFVSFGYSSGTSLYYWDKTTGKQSLVDHYWTSIQPSDPGYTESINQVSDLLQAVAPNSSGVVFGTLTTSNQGNYGRLFTDASWNGGMDFFWWDKATGALSLITHSAVNLYDAQGVVASTFNGISGDSLGAVFSNNDATKFGNNGVAFTDTGVSGSTFTDIFWWDKTTFAQQLITHSSVSNTSSAATASSAFDAIGPDSLGVVFQNINATQFGNGGIAFGDADPTKTDLFWWNKLTGVQQLITHGSTSTTSSESLANSSFVAVLPDHSAIFRNPNAAGFGNNGTAFTDSNTGVDDFFLWDASTDTIRLLTGSVSDANASSAGSFTYAGVSADGNWLYLTAANVGVVPGINGAAMTDGSPATNDIIAIRLGLLDLPSSCDTGVSAYDNVTSQRSFTVTAFASANEDVVLKDNGTQVVAATADANGNVSFALNNVALGTHNYTMYDALSGNQLTLVAGDLSSRATRLQVVVVQPTVQSFTTADLTPANDPAVGKTGDTLQFTVNFSEALSSTGSLTAHFLMNNRDVIATASAITGATSAVFTATAPTGDGSSISLTSLSVDGAGTITSDASQAALAAPMVGSITNAAFRVDNTAPTAQVTAAGAVVQNVRSLDFYSTEGGMAYFVNTAVTVNGLADILSAPGNKVVQTTIAAGDNYVSNVLWGTLTDGTYRLYTVDAAGNLSAASTNTVTIDITAPSVTAVYNSPENTATATTPRTITLTAQDANSVTWSALTGTDAASFTLSGNTLSFAGVTNYEAKPSYSVNVTATDAAGNATVRAITINIADLNDTPVVSAIGRQIAGVGQPYALDLSSYFLDPDVQAAGTNFGWHILTYSLTSGTLPAWATLNASTGLISGTPDGTAALTNYTVTASDGGGLSVSQSFQLQVAAQTLTSTALASPLLITHSSGAGNADSAATASSSFGGRASSSTGLAFSNVNAAQLGNNTAAFSDSSPTLTDYFWWDSLSGTQQLITHNSMAGNAASSQTVASTGLTVSADGSGAVFGTTMPIQFGNNGVAFADSLNANGQNKLIWWNASTGIQQLITHDNTAGYGTSALTSAASLLGIAPTGSGVLFQSLDVSTLGNTATGRFTDAGTGFTDVVWWDKATGTQKLVSHGGVSNNGSLAQANATYQGLATDGSGVVFLGLDATKYGNNGVAFADSQAAVGDLFWWDNATGTQSLISHNSTAGNASSSSAVAPTYQAILPDASGVIFSIANASALGNNGVGFTQANTTATKLFFWDKATGVQTLIDHSKSAGNADSAATANSTLNATASDSAGVVFSNVNATQFGNNGVAFTDAGTAATDLFWWDKATGVERLISHSSAAGNSASAATAATTFNGIAADSSGVVFSNVNATQFGNNGAAFTDTGTSGTAITDLFWWNKSDSTLQLITHSSASTTNSAATAASAFDAIAADGSGVVFHNPNATQFGNGGAAFTDAATGAGDLFWWDKATGSQQLITHSASSTTASAAATASTFVAALPDHSVIFSNANASAFGDSVGAFLDSNTSATDYFLWDAVTGNVRLLTEGAPDASSGATYSYNGVSGDGNWLYLTTPNVGVLPASSGAPMTDAGPSANDLVAIRLSLLDLVTAYDNGVNAYDNTTSVRDIQLNGFVNANESVFLKDNGAQVATATADANGLAVFNVTAAIGTHVYTLFDSTTGYEITLATGDLLSRAAQLTVMGI
ncbi:MAG: putative Ig domain-containing protein [Rhodoferax sp.]